MTWLSVYSWLIDSLGIKSTLKSVAIQAQALLLPLLVWLSEKMDNSVGLNGTYESDVLSTEGNDRICHSITGL